MEHTNAAMCLISPGGDADWEYAIIGSIKTEQFASGTVAGELAPSPGRSSMDVEILLDLATQRKHGVDAVKVARILQRSIIDGDPISIMIPPTHEFDGLIGGRGYVFLMKDSASISICAGWPATHAE